MLAQQSGLGPLGADIRHAERLSANHRQAERGAQYLSAAFAGGAIKFDHFPLSSYAGISP